MNVLFGRCACACALIELTGVYEGAKYARMNECMSKMCVNKHDFFFFLNIDLVTLGNVSGTVFEQLQ